LVKYDADIDIATGGNRLSVNWRNERIKWSALVNKLSETKRTCESYAEYMSFDKDRQDKIKDIGGFVGGIVKNGRRTVANIESRSLITLDADYCTPELYNDFILLFGNACVLHTTHKHSPATYRARLIIPMSRTVSCDEYKAIARAIAGQLNIEAFDDTTYDVNRLMYWPSTAADGEYIFKYEDAPWLNPDDVLASYADWRDMSSWPVSSRVKDKLKNEISRKQADPLEKPGWIGFFCRCYSIQETIEFFLNDVYAPCGSGRYTYINGSTSAGLVTYEDVFAYSHHSTDPACSKLCNAFDLVRIHNFKGSLQDTLTWIKSLPAVRRAAAEELKPKDFTDSGNAAVFVKKYEDKLIFVKALGWLYWTGQKWEVNDLQAVQYGMNLAGEMLDLATLELIEARKAISLAEAEQAKLDEARRMETEAKRFLKHAFSVRMRSVIDNMLKLSQPALHVKLNNLDADPFMLNTPAGIVDLRTGLISPHDPKRLCANITKVTPGNVNMNLWEDLLKTITCGNADLESFLQMVAGMTAIGKVFTESMTIAYGDGSNGKSTYYNSQAAVLGDYAGTIAAEALTTDRRNTGPDLAELKGKRLVIAAELEEGKRLSTSMLKQIASVDDITGEKKYKDPEKFTPSHSIVLYTNHRPKVGSTDTGTWRRITLIPFNATISVGQKVENYGAELAEKAGGAILSWVIEGAMRYHKNKHKLIAPAIVLDATDKYREANDWIGAFIEECCLTGKGLTAKSGELYNKYRERAEKNGEYVRHNSDFRAELEDHRGYEWHKESTGNLWYGIGLKVEV